VRAREVAALARKQVRPEIKKLSDFLETGNSTLFLSIREVSVIVEELNTLKDKNERAAKAIRRRMKALEEMLSELEGA
jgi:hypothetical protein